MSWTAPRTWVAGELVTAALGNTHWRDNLLETAPAKASAEGGIFVGTAANAIAERITARDTDDTGSTTASTSFVTLTGAPAITITTGTIALVLINAYLVNNTQAGLSFAGVVVSGATTRATVDDECAWYQAAANNYAGRQGVAVLMNDLTAGSNVFTMQHRVTAGTGTFNTLELIVIPLS